MPAILAVYVQRADAAMFHVPVHAHHQAHKLLKMERQMYLVVNGAAGVCMQIHYF